MYEVDVTLRAIYEIDGTTASGLTAGDKRAIAAMAASGMVIQSPRGVQKILNNPATRGIGGYLLRHPLAAVSAYWLGAYFNSTGRQQWLGPYSREIETVALVPILAESPRIARWLATGAAAIVRPEIVDAFRGTTTVAGGVAESGIIRSTLLNSRALAPFRYVARHPAAFLAAFIITGETQDQLGVGGRGILERVASTTALAAIFAHAPKRLLPRVAQYISRHPIALGAAFLTANLIDRYYRPQWLGKFTEEYITAALLPLYAHGVRVLPPAIEWTGWSVYQGSRGLAYGLRTAINAFEPGQQGPRAGAIGFRALQAGSAVGLGLYLESTQAIARLRAESEGDDVPFWARYPGTGFATSTLVHAAPESIYFLWRRFRSSTPGKVAFKFTRQVISKYGVTLAVSRLAVGVGTYFTLYYFTSKEWVQAALEDRYPRIWALLANPTTISILVAFGPTAGRLVLRRTLISTLQNAVLPLRYVIPVEKFAMLRRAIHVSVAFATSSRPARAIVSVGGRAATAARLVGLRAGRLVSRALGPLAAVAEAANVGFELERQLEAQAEYLNEIAGATPDQVALAEARYNLAWARAWQDDPLVAVAWAISPGGPIQAFHRAPIYSTGMMTGEERVQNEINIATQIFLELPAARAFLQAVSSVPFGLLAGQNWADGLFGPAVRTFDRWIVNEREREAQDPLFARHRRDVSRQPRGPGGQFSRTNIPYVSPINPFNQRFLDALDYLDRVSSPARVVQTQNAFPGGVFFETFAAGEPASGKGREFWLYRSRDRNLMLQTLRNMLTIGARDQLEESGKKTTQISVREAIFSDLVPGLPGSVEFVIDALKYGLSLVRKRGQPGVYVPLDHEEFIEYLNSMWPNLVPGDNNG